MKACEIRAARTGDISALARIADETLELLWNESAFRGAFAQTSVRATVAVDAGGSVRGFVVGSLVADEAEVLALGVEEPWRGRGVGQALVAEFAARVRAEGAARIQLEVRDGNSPALALYRRNGFGLQGRRRRYYPDGSDALLLGAAL